MNNKQKDNKDNKDNKDYIKYAQGYFIGNKNNPFGIIDLYYCNLTEDYSITPLTILKDYKEKKKQDAVLEYIENILIINTHLHLQERTVLRYINNNDLIYTTPHIRNIFKEVNKIASEGKKTSNQE